MFLQKLVHINLIVGVEWRNHFDLHAAKFGLASQLLLDRIAFAQLAYIFESKQDDKNYAHEDEKGD